MYIAELKSKLSSNLETSEDILTSNVFSFFKYANRNVYLKHLLSEFDVHPTYKELRNAEFQFWPHYDDGTEPDLLIITNKYYLLFEAKYFSTFRNESFNKAGQLTREIENGHREASMRGLKFIFVTITMDASCPRKILDFIIDHGESIKWFNWQKVARILLEALEMNESQSSDNLMATDLYDLLDKKRLRGFLSFSRLQLKELPKCKPVIFLNIEKLCFSSVFIGFESSLSFFKPIMSCNQQLFLNKSF